MSEISCACGHARQEHFDNHKCMSKGCGCGKYDPPKEVVYTSAALRDLRRQAEMAKNDPGAFMEFVFKSEVTHKRIKLAAHQRVIFDFVLAHRACAIISAVGHSKTTSIMAYVLWRMAQDTNFRAAMLSKTQSLAKKPVNAVRQLIESEPRLRMVNPRLRPGRRPGDTWSDVKFTLDRDLGTRDATFAAAGLETGIGGSRLDAIVCDDLLDTSNCATPDQRKKTIEIFDSMINTRLSRGGQVILMNSPFHKEDLINTVKDVTKWPTLEMDAYGEVRLYNVDPDWGEELLVEEHRDEDAKLSRCRLRAHEPDPDHKHSLWPEMFPLLALEQILEERYPHNPAAFARSYRCDVLDEQGALCQQAFIDKCLELSRNDFRNTNEPKYVRFQARYQGSNPTFTGIDLAVSQKDSADMTAMFTFEVRLHDGVCVILDIEYGRWDAMTIVNKAFQKHEAFKSAIAVENNASQQFIVQIMNTMNKYVPVTGLATTDHAKMNPEYGVVEIFYELANGMWRLPNDNGAIDPRVKEFIKSCRYYSPTKHPADVLMASFVGRRLAHDWGLLGKRLPPGARPLPSGLNGALSPVGSR